MKVALAEIVPAKHAELLFLWRQQPDVARFMYSAGPLSWEAHVRWLESLPAQTSRRHWVITQGERPVGSAYLTEIDQRHGRGMFGMYVADEGARVLGAGAAAEFLALDHAFEMLELQKVSCEVFAVNVAPLRMHARLGFQREGVLRRHAWCEGAWVDVHRLSLLREEWAKVRPGLQRMLTKLLGTSPASARPALSLP